MREMIFNEASLTPASWTVEKAKTSLVNMAQGMIALIAKLGLSQRLRLPREMPEIKVAGDESLYSLLVILIRNPNTKAEARFWMGLATKAPLLYGLPDDVKDRFLGCEPAMEITTDTNALVLCAIQCAIAISLPTVTEWERDQLTIRFKELLCDGSVEDVSEIIDNLAGTKQAEGIISRYEVQASHQLTSATFWEKRAEVFPSLLFGLDVERQIADIGENQFETIKGCLSDLNITAKNWHQNHALAWGRKVTQESNKTMNNPSLARFRYFKNQHGVSQLFEWHARFGSSGRIHLFPNFTDHTIEIGYIGPHLPL
ncbi:hypothetical protein H8L32_26405 [Undibacterium sp. CY18W]|uniref:Uncharacterized protein n=1 Tax=Undibacterium hunanense TaxID=2762292 RepID=A0ABR6ZZ45_9BURK|nr:hypothetical protein [Undibacterium hunanense]MBC3921024.1 hypothetical protein [Undibacterium hunanense]